MIRALIVDDEPLARQLVREMLESDEEFEECWSRWQSTVGRIRGLVARTAKKT